MNIAVLYICTGEYWRFWQRFRESAAQHLLLGEHVRYFVFSDPPLPIWCETIRLG